MLRNLLLVSGLVFGAALSADLELEIHGAPQMDDSLHTVAVLVSVTDHSGNGIAGLDSTNFHISCFDDVMLLPEVDVSSRGVGLVISVDVSGTMRNQMSNVKTALGTYLDSLRTQDRVAILSFADTVRVESEFSNNANYLKSVVESLTTWGNRTALFQGIHQGLTYSRNSLPDHIEESYLLVFSDGKDDDRVGTVTLEDCIDLARELSVPVISVGLIVQFEDCADHLANMQALSDATGGYFKVASTGEQLEQAFRTALSITRNKYLLTFSVPDSLVDGHLQEYTIHVAWSSAEASKAFYLSLGEVEDVEEGASSLLWIVISAVLIVIFLVIYASLRRRNRRKVALLNSELKRSRERIRGLEQEIISSEKQIPPGASEDIFEEDSGADDFSSLKPRRLHTETSQSEPAPRPARKPKHTMIDTGAQRYSKAELKVLNGSESGLLVDVSRPETTIGRAQDCVITLNDNGVSAKHATVRCADSQFHVVDNDSRNGTFLNGARIRHSYLKDGDVIRVGRIELRFGGSQ